MIGTMAMYVNVDKMKHADAATRWIKENKEIWESWLFAK